MIRRDIMREREREGSKRRPLIERVQQKKVLCDGKEKLHIIQSPNMFCNHI